MSKEKLIFYFGYGSNMSLKYLQGRRGVYPVESYPGVLKGFSLIMNMEGPIFVEPSFANIIKNEQGTVEGVLHLITKNELQKRTFLAACFSCLQNSNAVEPRNKKMHLIDLL